MKTVRETPDHICELLVREADLYNKRANFSILEPSAGSGKIIKEILKYHKNINIVAVELNKPKCDSLFEIKSKHKELTNVIHGDFLTIDILSKFDRVIACPPFKGNLDLEHIKKMYDLLLGGGIIVSLISPYFITNNEPHQVDFRKWLEGKKYSFQLLADNTFMERNKSVPTALIKIHK